MLDDPECEDIYDRWKIGSKRSPYAFEIFNDRIPKKAIHQEKGITVYISGHNENTGRLIAVRKGIVIGSVGLTSTTYKKKYGSDFRKWLSDIRKNDQAKIVNMLQFANTLEQDAIKTRKVAEEMGEFWKD